MRGLRLILVSLVAIPLTGCVEVALNAATFAYKQGDRPTLRPLAEAGDPDAQTGLGQTYCCFGPGFSVWEATKWFCKAARQGHGPAYYELGRVYSGDVVRSISPSAHVVGRATARRSEALSLAYFDAAAAQGIPNAKTRADAVRKKLNDEELALARQYSANPSGAPCRFSQVFPDVKPGFRPAGLPKSE